MMISCPYCLKRVFSEYANFCSNCGQQLRELPSEVHVRPEKERRRPMPVVWEKSSFDENNFIVWKNRGDKIQLSKILEELPSDDILRELFPFNDYSDEQYVTHLGLQIIRLRINGFRQKEIADELNITPGKVAYWSDKVKYGLTIYIPPYIDIDIPAVRKILRISLPETDKRTLLSELLQDMPSDEELARLFAKQGNILGSTVKQPPTNADLQLLQMRRNKRSYASISDELGISEKEVRRRVQSTLTKLSRDLRVVLDVPEIYKRRRSRY